MGWVSGLIGQRTFRFWAIAAALVMSMAALAGGIAYGNTASCTNTAATLTDSAFEVDTNANLIVNNPGCVDWLSGGTGTGFRTGVTVKTDTASGSGDESFGNGTKEDTAVPSVVDGGIPPNKSDLKAFGVFTEQGQVSTANPTGKYLALFWTRVQDPSGTTNMDFELNQSTTKSANGVTPVRTNGDLLITYDLSNGGSVATISKRTWNNGSWGPAQAVSPAKGSINTSLIPANQAATLGSLDPRTFGEAILPFNALFGQNTCGQFGSAYLKSRSSDSFTAALKDFVPPAAVSISNCAALTTNATQSATIGSPISDTATLAGVTTSAGGTITFKAFGPNDANCSGTAAFTSAAIAVSGPGNYNSGNFIPSAVGTYRWTASYSGDGSNAPASSACNAANESSVVNQASPNIVTSATQSVTVGSAISDTATLSGATSNAGGTITFKAFGPNDANCSGTAAFTSAAIAVSGPGNYNSGNFIPSAVGTYRWTASYSGDGNNAPASSPCNAENETSTVNQAGPGLNTNATQSVTIDSPISDTATLSGGQNPTGTITFKAFGPNDADCSGTAAYTNQVTVSGNGDYPSGDFTPTEVGTYRWTASYSGDGNNAPASSPCNAENETSTVNKAAANVATAQKLFPQDSATLSASAGGTPTGTVDFTLYGPNDANCAGPAVYTENNVTLTGGTANTDNTTVSVNQASSGNYKWIVHYDGDAKHEEETSACGKEAFLATIDNDTTN